MTLRLTRILLLVAFAATLLAGAAGFPKHAYADDPETVPLLVIVVGFDGGDGKADATVAPYDRSYDWSAAVFGSDDSLAAYYLDMSNGTFTFSPAAETCAYGGSNKNKPDQVDDGVVHVTLHQPHGAWGLVNEDMAIAQEFGKVVIEAFKEASAYVDMAAYDENGDGLLTPDELAVCVCIAGYDASPFEHPDRRDIPVMWPHTGMLADTDDANDSADGVSIASYIAIAEYLTSDEGTPVNVEQEALGVLYHELGHHLGLIDLYPLNANSEEAVWGAYRVGKLSLMDNGGWALVNDNEAPLGFWYEPAAFDAWSRYALGWETPAIATTSGDYAVSSQLSDQGYRALLIPTPNPDEYYLLENRQPEGHDASIPTEFTDGNPNGGIVIWHIDKGVYRQYGAENMANDTNHTPAVMELYFEESDGRYSVDWQRSTPLLQEPFYDKATCEANLGNPVAAINLPLYGTDPSKDSPSERTQSGVAVSFPSTSSRDMTVHVEFSSEIAGNIPHALPLDSHAVRELRTGTSELGHLACAALIEETDADVAVIDAQSILAGLPNESVSWSDTYGVLPSDANIACYDMTGTQLVELAERSASVAAPYQRVQAAREALLALDIIDHVPELDELASNANTALTFDGLEYDVNWKAPDGNRISNVRIAGEPIDPAATYYVAMTPGVPERYDLFDALNPNTLMLWGSPADAFRSFIQRHYAK